MKSIKSRYESLRCVIGCRKNVIESDRRSFAHSAEYAIWHSEEINRGIEFLNEEWLVRNRTA
jgi:hypothetical protein